MSLTSFGNVNTTKARTTAIAAFKRMLEEENVSMELVQASILLDSSGKRLAATMDRFGFYLATNEGKNCKLARNTAISYYRNTKLWFFDLCPHLRVPPELQLLKQSKTLDRHCLKREKGGYVNKAPPCTKDDLRALTKYVYSNARVNADYQDAALACLMWHCFGRSPDLGSIQKQHISVSADGVFYLRLLRVETAEEQGLTLVPDKSDFLTCPLHALAVALVTQDAPCGSLFSQLPELVPEEATNLDPGAPLIEILEAEPASLSVPLSAASVSGFAGVPSEASLHIHSSPAGTQPKFDATSNRARVSINADYTRTRRCPGVREPPIEARCRTVGATGDLTSHSFRRGGAQHANGDKRLAAQWIFDRGPWDMSKVNKGFAYVFNTPQEDRKVARVLSGWGVDEDPEVADVSSLDHATQEQLDRLQSLLYSSCTGLKEHRYNVSRKVLAVLTAYLIKYFPQMKALLPSAPFVTRVEECLDAASIARVDMLAWSSALNSSPSRPAKTDKPEEDKTKGCQECHHSAVIEELMAMNRMLAARLTIVEAALLKPTEIQANTEASSVGFPFTRTFFNTSNINPTNRPVYTITHKVSPFRCGRDRAPNLSLISK